MTILICLLIGGCDLFFLAALYALSTPYDPPPGRFKTYEKDPRILTQLRNASLLHTDCEN